MPSPSTGPNRSTPSQAAEPCGVCGHDATSLGMLVPKPTGEVPRSLDLFLTPAPGSFPTDQTPFMPLFAAMVGVVLMGLVGMVMCALSIRQPVIALVAATLFVVLLRALIKELPTFNAEYDEFSARFNDLLHEARHGCLFPDQESLEIFAQNQVREVFAREAEYLQRAALLRESVHGRFYNFILTRYEHGGREIIAYIHEPRRLVMAAYFYRSRVSETQQRLRDAQNEAGVEAIKAGILADAELAVELEQKRRMEEHYRESENGTNQWP